MLFLTLALSLTLTGRAQVPDSRQTTTTAPVRPASVVVDATVADDTAVEALIQPYRLRVTELSKVVGTLETDIERRGIGAGTIGNFVADAMRSEATRRLQKPVAVAITNYGGLRKPRLVKGDLRATDIYELLPFENALVTLELTGAQLQELFQKLVSERDPQSGAVIGYTVNAANRPQLTTLELIKSTGKSGNRNKKPRTEKLKPTARYTIVTTDYLVNRGGNYAILKQGANLQPLNLTLRDAVIEFVKNETRARRTLKPQLDYRFTRTDGGTPDTGEGR